MRREGDIAVQDMSLEQIERRVQDIRRNYEEFFASARDGFYISTRGGRFIDANNALVQMLGYHVTEEVLEIDITDELWARPEDRAEFQARIEEQGFVKNYNAMFKRADGTLLPVTLSSEVWTDPDGEVLGYRGFVVDQTHDRLMRHQLKTVELKYRELLENTREGVFVADAKGMVLDCNWALCEIIGYTKEELLGMNYYEDLFLEADDVRDFRREFTRSGRVTERELQIRRKDGSIRDVSVNGYAGENSAGEVISYQGLMRDITEAKRLRRQLIQAERLTAMGKMASQLAHELNNPIYGITNCLELIKEVVPEGHERRRFLDLAREECRRVSGLLRKMLNFFRPDDEKKEQTDINKLIDEILLFYGKQFKDRGIETSTDFDPDLPWIMAVSNHMKQVFINMIMNAVSAMPDGGELRVATKYAAKHREIAVVIEDTGVGIPPENIDKIFDAFFTTKNEVKGVGLGLSICYGLVGEHGGTIDVDSNEGKGATFVIRLPVEPQWP